MIRPEGEIITEQFRQLGYVIPEGYELVATHETVYTTRQIRKQTVMKPTRRIVWVKVDEPRQLGLWDE